MLHFLLLPGIFLHEFSHFIVGLLLNAKPTNFSLLPDKKAGSNGHVSFRNVNFINALPIAIAPMLGGATGLYYLYITYFYNFKNLDFIHMGLVIYFTIVFLKTMTPSDTDMKIAFSYPLGVLLYGFIGFATYKYFTELS